tara:strand:+ start:268 stop:483 length:216 start_codon:yes stop_codon:yes gene_type:complete
MTDSSGYKFTDDEFKNSFDAFNKVHKILNNKYYVNSITNVLNNNLSKTIISIEGVKYRKIRYNNKSMYVFV